MAGSENLISTDCRVVVCVPSYKKVHILRECLLKLSKLETKGFEVKSLVVDSGSDAKELATLGATFPDVEIERIDNRGYVGCVNHGISYAMDNGYDYVLIVTDDALVEPSSLRELIKPLEEDEKAAIAGCRILHISKSTKGERKMVVMPGAYLGDSLLSRAKIIPEESTDLTVCDWVNGAVVAMKVSVFQKVGLLDESFFMYFDELDLGLKLKRNGYHALYVPWVEVVHESGSDFYGITSKDGHSYARYYLTRNVALLYYKMSAIKFTLFLPYFIVTSIVRSLILLTKGRSDCSLAIMRGVRDFFFGRLGRGPY